MCREKVSRDSSRRPRGTGNSAFATSQPEEERNVLYKRTKARVTADLPLEKIQQEDETTLNL